MNETKKKEAEALFVTEEFINKLTTLRDKINNEREEENKRKKWYESEIPETHFSKSDILMAKLAFREGYIKGKGWKTKVKK